MICRHHGGRIGASKLETKLQNDCIIWDGPTCANGRYGRLAQGNFKMAHREAYEKSHGAIPVGMVVRHSCDNGLCVNPDHLSVGTQSQNMRDCITRGRHKTLLKNQSGDGNANAKYTKDFAESVRKHHADTKCSYQALADHFQLKSKGHAHAIVTGKIWQ